MGEGKEFMETTYDMSASALVDLTWTLNKKGVLRISGHGNMTDYKEWGNMPPWKGQHITGVIIENGVTSIGVNAFKECFSLKKATVSDSVTSIGDRAFKLCRNLVIVTIPDSVTVIGNAAFYDCHNLNSVTVPDGVTFIENSTFHGCHSLNSVTIPDSVTSIGYDAFYGCRHYKRDYP